jgi:hypothetical protein
VPSSTTKIFHHQYHTLEELFLSGGYIYSTLLKAKDPSSCQFKIEPSPKFQSCQNKNTRRLYFSINAKQEAKESLTIPQLEALVSDLSGYKFEYIEGLLINAEFNINHLPEFISGDSLYDTNTSVLNLLNSPIDLSTYELRYISPRIGFGLFTREPIKQNQLMFIYAGRKESKISPTTKYAFLYKEDVLNMYLDARHYGNLARFINHAPRPKENIPLVPQTTLMEANLESTYENINGIEVILFTANRHIAKGEQLLVDYGEKFFHSTRIYQFKGDGKIFRLKKRWGQKDSKNKLRHYKIMARHGIKKAQQYILLRMMIIITSIITLMYIWLG